MRVESESLFDGDADGADPDFLAARNDAITRAYLDGLWQRYRNIAEKDFPGRLREPGRFHETFTEMYVACHLMHCGWEVERRRGGGPDFLAKSAVWSFLVEATVPEAGKGVGTVPSPVFDAVARDVPQSEIEYRFVRAIEAKAANWRAHVRREPADATLPVVLFVNLFRSQYGWIPHDLPLWLLLGTNGTEGMTGQLAYARGQFLLPEYRWLGAVVAARVHAPSVALGEREILTMHNPNADPGVPEGAWGDVGAKEGNVREFTRADCQGLLNP